MFSGSTKREEQFFTAAAVVADSPQDNRKNFFGEILGGFPAASDQMFRRHAGNGLVKALLLGDFGHFGHLLKQSDDEYQSNEHADSNGPDAPSALQESRKVG